MHLNELRYLTIPTFVPEAIRAWNEPYLRPANVLHGHK
jgi:hypothetical protein